MEEVLREDLDGYDVRVRVEVGGVEPPSFGPLLELLRAQPVSDLGPASPAGTGGRPQSAEMSLWARRHDREVSPA